MEFNRIKVSGIYWLECPIERLILKISLKRQGSITLPKFEEYFKRTDDGELHSLDYDKVEEHSFKWQEKVFSITELEKYKNIHNCTTETELHYHEVLKQNTPQHGKIFTYVDGDNYGTLEFSKKFDHSVGVIDSCLKKLNISNLEGDTASTRTLFRDSENISVEDVEWTTMHVMLDDSEYNGDSDLVLKRETVLLKVLWCPKNNCLIITPDANDLEWKPYSVESTSGVRWNYQYAVDFYLDDSSKESQIIHYLSVLKKLQKKWDRKHRNLLKFEMPPFDVKRHYVNIEILCTSGFEAANLYIEYEMKIPEEAKCENSLRGCTQTSRSNNSECDLKSNFSHMIELVIDYDINSHSPPPTLFMEVISCDWWKRHRTEGYGYTVVSLSPGCHKGDVVCIRPEEIDQTLAESRRFFLGGCHLLEDMTVLAVPGVREKGWSSVGTGSVHIRWSSLRQSTSSASGYGDTVRRSSAVALLHGADAVLRQYKRAKARLAAAARDIPFDDKYSKTLSEECQET